MIVPTVLMNKSIFLPRFHKCQCSESVGFCGVRLVLVFSSSSRHRALWEDPPAPILRSVKSDVSQAEHPAGFPAPEHHRNQEESHQFLQDRRRRLWNMEQETEGRNAEEHQNTMRRRGSLDRLRPNFTLQSTPEADIETKHINTVQETPPSHIITHQWYEKIKLLKHLNISLIL